MASLDQDPSQSLCDYFSAFDLLLMRTVSLRVKDQEEELTYT
jgi:hypothetical protein